MELILAYYVGSITVIGLIMQIIVKVDEAMDSWSLAYKFNVWGFEFSLLNVVGLVISFITSIVMTVIAGYPWLYALAGAIGIYFTEYAVGKLGWKKVFEMIIKLSSTLSKKG